MTTSDPPLDQAYRDTDYRVRLATGGHASIRIGQPLPAALRPAAGASCWGLLTAWNPDSQPHSRAANHAAQRQLLHDLAQYPDSRWWPAIGIGHDGWREPSGWILNLSLEQLQALAQRYRQRAWVRADPSGLAILQYSAQSLPPALRAGW